MTQNNLYMEGDEMRLYIDVQPLFIDELENSKNAAAASAAAAVQSEINARDLKNQIADYKTGLELFYANAYNGLTSLYNDSVSDFNLLKGNAESSLQSQNDTILGNINSAKQSALSNISTNAQSYVNQARSYAEQAQNTVDNRVSLVHLNQSKALETGSISTDADVLADVTSYAHSTFDRSKFTITGSPTITGDGVASGFSSGNYITTQTINLSDANSWEINVPYKFSSFTNQQRPLMGYQNGHEFIVVQQDANRAYIGVYLSSTGSSFDIMSGEITDKGALTVDTDYIITIKFTGTQYLVYVNGVLWKTVTSSTKVPFNSSLRFSGIYFAQTSYGSVDLSRFSITVDGAPVFSGNKTGVDTIYVDYTEHGSPTISNEGILSSADDSNYVTTNSDIDLTGSDWDYIVPINLKANSLTSGCQLLYNSSRVTLITISTSLKVTLYFTGSPANFSHTSTNSVPLGKGFLKISHKGTSYSVKYSTDKETWTNIDAFTDADTPVGNNPISIGGGYSTLSMTGSEIEIDLSGIQFIKNSGLAYRPCLIIPYTESKTGSKIVNSIYRDRVADAYNLGYLNYIYYTLDETNGNFTLPMGEIYGMIENLRKLIMERTAQEG